MLEVLLIGIVAIYSTYYSLNNFSEAFPSLSLTISASKEDAQQISEDYLEAIHIAPWSNDTTIPVYSQAASFESDSSTKTFLSLHCDDSVLVDLIAHSDHYLYNLFYWEVRNYREKEIPESSVLVTPSGQLYGFSETLAEALELPNLDQGEARELAEAFATSPAWSLPLSEFDMIETKQDLKISNRLDWTFVYERKHISFGPAGPDQDQPLEQSEEAEAQSDQVHENNIRPRAKLRLAIKVSGNRVTALSHYTYLPEWFGRTFEEMRSSNTLIASVCSAVMVVLFFLLGTLGMYYLKRATLKPVLIQGKSNPDT